MWGVGGGVQAAPRGHPSPEQPQYPPLSLCEVLSARTHPADQGPPGRAVLGGIPRPRQMGMQVGGDGCYLGSHSPQPPGHPEPWTGVFFHSMPLPPHLRNGNVS